MELFCFCWVPEVLYIFWILTPYKTYDSQIFSLTPLSFSFGVWENLLFYCCCCIWYGVMKLGQNPGLENGCFPWKQCEALLFFFFFSWCQGSNPEPRASCVLNDCSATQIHSQLQGTLVLTYLILTLIFLYYQRENAFSKRWIKLLKVILLMVK